MSAVMAAPIPRQEGFAFEKGWMDSWAIWRESGFFDQAKPSSPLARMQELGVCLDPSGYGSEPEINDIGERVQAFMTALARDFPRVHVCLEARHRRVVGSIPLGQKREESGRLRPYYDREIAEICLGAGQSTLMQYRRLCETGYLKLRSFMRRS